MFAINNRKIALSVLILAATVGVSVTRANAFDGFITKVPAQEGSYCHLKFPAIRSSTLASKHPQLKSPQSGDVIDYYGACDHDPLGRDEVLSQWRADERRWEND
jgi:hypothetical protein